MATTAPKGDDRSEKRRRPFGKATTVYETEICSSESASLSMWTTPATLNTRRKSTDKTTFTHKGCPYALKTHHFHASICAMWKPSSLLLDQGNLAVSGLPDKNNPRYPEVSVPSWISMGPVYPDARHNCDDISFLDT
ncbi:hypothetical protein Bbelb_172250 [Branchiostoma belcheri]|nr:hypothetical protein Bbelb_172250 [Branchiostoma belcheri]